MRGCPSRSGRSGSDPPPVPRATSRASRTSTAPCGPASRDSTGSETAPANPSAPAATRTSIGSVVTTRACPVKETTASTPSRYGGTTSPRPSTGGKTPSAAAVSTSASAAARGPKSSIVTGSAVRPEAAAGLAAEVAGGDELLEQRRRCVARLAELQVQRALDGQRHLEADDVEQLERPHRVAAARLHRGVDVVGRRVVVCEHPHGVVQVGEEQG